MKIIIILLTSLTMYGCCDVVKSDKDYSLGKNYSNDTSNYFITEYEIAKIRYWDSYLISLNDTSGFGPLPVTVLTHPIQDVDSSKVYWQRFNKYQKLMNAELERLNRLKSPTITTKLLRYQDSSIRYKILLDRLKTK